MRFTRLAISCSSPLRSRSKRVKSIWPCNRPVLATLPMLRPISPKFPLMLSLAGSIGMLPSASLGGRKPSGVWVGLYEPVHGSAPDIAGQNKANPLGAIGSVAAMLEYSFGLKEEAARVNAAIEAVLDSGRVTADLKPSGAPATTEQVGEAVCAAIG